MGVFSSSSSFCGRNGFSAQQQWGPEDKEKNNPLSGANSGCRDSSQCGNTAAEMCCKCREAAKLKSHIQ